MKMKHTALWHWTAGFLLSSLAPLYAQPAALYSIPERGVVPNGSYAVSKIETISTTTGNLSIHIPLASLPAGRAGLAANVDLYYNSSVYASYTDTPGGTVQTIIETSDAISPDDFGGWHYGFNYALVADIIYTDDCPPVGIAGNVTYRLVMPDGSSHVLHILGRTDDNLGSYYFANCTIHDPAEGGDLTMYTADGTYLRMHVNGSSFTPGGYAWTLFLPDGRKVVGANASTTDIFDANYNGIYPNGNGIHITRTTPGGIPTTTLTDDLNRTITIQNHLGTSGQDTITQAGYLAQPLQWTVNWTTYTLSPGHNYLCVPSQQGYCDAGATGSAISQSVVSSITLPTTLPPPQQQQYTFLHDASSSTAWGQLSQMTMPSGAQVAYTYGPMNVVPWSPASPKVLSKTLTWTDENNSNTLRTESSGYSFTDTSSTFTNADGGITDHYFYSLIGPPYVSVANPLSGLEYQSQNRQTGDVFEKIWALNIPYGTPDGLTHQTFINPGNPYVATDFRSVGTYGAPALTSAKNYVYDRNGNRRTISEYDWFPYGNVSHGGGITPAPATGFSGTLVRSTSNVFVNGAGNAISSDGTQIDNWGYWNPLSPQLLDSISRSTVSGVGPGSDTKFTYDCSTWQTPVLTHGNVTQEDHWDSASGSWLTVKHGYDSANPGTCVSTGVGNPTYTTDARGNSTVYSYDAQNLYINQMVQAYGTPDARTFTFQHDYYSGLLTQKFDADHVITTNLDYDPYGRNKMIAENGVRATRTTYDDSLRKIVVYSDLNANNDGALAQTTYYDQLGRVRLTQDAAGNTVLQGHYIPPNSFVNYDLVSNPFAAQGDSTMGWTKTTRDTDGRVIAVQHFSGPWGNETTSTGTSPTSYSTNCATSSDEAGVSRTSCADGLGRLTSVVENGIGATTTYGYDALDNLISVTQGSTTRGFTYSSLKRLITASNPESGTTGYVYDSNGNLYTRTDARGIVTTYCPAATALNFCYNGLDQVRSKRYSDATPPVTYTYNKSWLAQVQSSASTYSYVFDPIGRVKGGTQTTPTTGGPSYTFGATLKPTVGILSITYPNSGRVVTTVYDPSGRPVTLAGQIGTNPPTNYVTATSYQPHGAIAQQTLGNGLVVSRCNGTACDNARLQPTYISAGNLLSIIYGYSATQNNGNLLSQTITRGANTWSQNYTYDTMNRLNCANEVTGSSGVACNTGTPNWLQTYGYDARGNRWLNSVGPVNQTAEVIGSNAFDAANRIGAWNMANCYNGANCYDAAGNLKAIPATGGATVRTATYDAENRMISATAAGATTTYIYDGDGRRVQKTGGSATTTFVYDPFGNLAQEYGPPTDSGTKYITADHLGSTRLVTDQTGVASKCYDYLPFGEELANGTGGRGNCFGVSQYPTSPDVLSTKFTSKERDAETGLDYFGARYMSSAQGRFTSADSPSYASLKNPQAWNLFAYALNNPLKYIDPDGHEVVCHGDTQQCKDAIAAATANTEAAKRVTTNTATTQHSFLGIRWTTSKTTIAISGDLSTFRALGQNASKLADLVSDRREFGFNASSSTYKGDPNNIGTWLVAPGERPLHGGGQTITPTEGYYPASFVDPNAATYAIDTDAQASGIPPANMGEKAAHEFLGHLWGEMMAGHPAGGAQNKQDSLNAENAVRQLDPQRGQKTVHH